MRTPRTLALIFLLARAAGAQPFNGAPDDYLQYGVGARALGMGGAFGPLADDVTASVYNPAGLALLRSNEIQLMHAPFFYDTNLDYVGMAFPLTPSFAMGLSGVLLRSTGFEQRSASNEILGSGSIYNGAYLFSIAGRLSRLYVGATAKMLTQFVLGRQGSALGVDVGAICPINSWLRASLVLSNLNEPQIKLIDQPDVYRTRFAVGAAANVPGSVLTLVSEYKSNDSGGGALMGGGEVTIAKSFKLRGGLDSQASPTFGFGIPLSQLQFDYAFAKAPLGTLHRFSLSYRFGQLFRVKVSPEYENGESAVVLKAAANQITFRVEKPRFPTEWWKMVIYNRDGAVLREISGMGTPPQIFWWDLQDGLGRPIRDGLYPFEFQVKYKGGDVWSGPGEIKVVNQFQEEPIKMNLSIPGSSNKQ